MNFRNRKIDSYPVYPPHVAAKLSASAFCLSSMKNDTNKGTIKRNYNSLSCNMFVNVLQSSGKVSKVSMVTTAYNQKHMCMYVPYLYFESMLLD